jgi:serine/threonine protein kinase
MSEKTLRLKFNASILDSTKLSINYIQPSYTHNNYDLYNGNYEGIDEYSVLVLYNIEKNIEAFHRISNQINTYINLEIANIAKLHGIIVGKDRFYLVFEKLEPLVNIINSKIDKEKFSILIEVMEALINLHENKLSICDLRPSSIYLSQEGDVRLMFPLSI